MHVVKHPNLKHRIWSGIINRHWKFELKLILDEALLLANLRNACFCGRSINEKIDLGKADPWWNTMFCAFRGILREWSILSCIPMSTRIRHWSIETPITLFVLLILQKRPEVGCNWRFCTSCVPPRPYTSDYNLLRFMAHLMRRYRCKRIKKAEKKEFLKTSRVVPPRIWVSAKRWIKTLESAGINISTKFYNFKCI